MRPAVWQSLSLGLDLPSCYGTEVAVFLITQLPSYPSISHSARQRHYNGDECTCYIQGAPSLEGE